MNSTAQVALDELRRLQGITGEPSMAGDDCSCRYGVLGHHLRNEEHGEAEKLTASPTMVVAASGRLRSESSMAAANWREREGVVEVESKENEAKIAKWRYLRLRWVAVDLLGTSASSYALGRRD